MKQTLLTLLLACVHLLVHAQSGVISGRILDQDNLSLPGATILIPELGRGSISNEKGFFTILDVPEGSYTIKVSYIGYSANDQTVMVNSNTNSEVIVKLTESALMGEEVFIMGDRLRGQARALNNQRTNANITNVVASDQIGRFPDANIGDAMKRIPGITMQNDQGEARNIIIRGMAPQLNSVTLNGERIPSAEGDNRRVQMDLIPSDMIEMIQVNKAVTPDMDADAIGGSVNLVTRSAPSGQRISGTLASGYNFLSQKPVWTGSAILGDRYFNDKLGAVASLSYNNHNFGSDNVEAVWFDDPTYGPLIEEYDLRTYNVQRVRRSASLGLDYKINSNNTLYLNSMYNWRDDWENRYRFRVGRLDDAVEDGDFSEIEPGLYSALGRIERQTKGGINSDRVKSARLEDQRTANVTLRGDHLINNKIKLNWSGTYARASESRPDERYISYRTGGLPVTVDLRDPYFPIVTPDNVNQYQTLEFNEFTEQNQVQWEEDLNARLNLLLPLGEKGVFKTGFAYRGKQKKRENDFYELTPTGGIQQGDAHPQLGGSWDEIEGEYTDLFLGDVVSTDVSRDFLAGEQYRGGYYADPEFLGNLDPNNTALWERSDIPEEYITGNYLSSENITAGYAMADLQITKRFSGIAGVRIENTSIQYNGYSYDVDTEEVGETRGNNSYINFFPSVHLKFDMRENTIFRAAFTQTLARPDYFKLVPFESFDPDGPELTSGNPSLLPSVSTNADFMAENYFESIGLISAGFFYKKVNDFIYERRLNNFDSPKYGVVDFTTYENGGTATVAGLELAFQKQLDFLPGLGVYLNYTFTHSTTTGIEGREDEEIALPGTAGNMFNASLSYENEKMVIRVSANYTNDYIDELGGDSFEDRFYDKQFFLDFNGSYTLNKRLRAFVEINNLTNQPLRYYQGVEDRTMQIEYYNIRSSFGLKFDLLR